MNVLSLCDYTGNMVFPWVEAGHECICVDLQRAPEGALGLHIVADVLTDPRVAARVRWADIVFAAPTCRDLAGSGARWWAQKGEKAYHEAMHLVFRCRDIGKASGGKWMLENPVGRIPKAWRPWDYIFDPCDYGDGYTKRTCLWVGGGFVMPPKKRVPITEPGKIHKMAPSEDRAQKRSITPMGFARAVYEANRP